MTPADVKLLPVLPEVEAAGGGAETDPPLGAMKRFVEDVFLMLSWMLPSDLTGPD